MAKQLFSHCAEDTKDAGQVFHTCSPFECIVPQRDPAHIRALKAFLASIALAMGALAGVELWLGERLFQLPFFIRWCRLVMGWG
jgi:hypothetical protein